MTGKEYLQSIKKLVSQIENNSMKARTFRKMAGSVPSPSPSGDHVSYTPSGSASFEKYAHSIALFRRICYNEAVLKGG